MFLPFEGLYAEVVNINMGRRQKNYKVNIAGPSTMAAMLSSPLDDSGHLTDRKKWGSLENGESARKELRYRG